MLSGILDFNQILRTTKTNFLHIKITSNIAIV